MKNRRVLINVAIAATVLSAHCSAHAQPSLSPLCNDQLIRGTYAFVVEGEILVSPPPAGPLMGVAMTTFDGKGGLTQIDSISLDGVAKADFSPPTTGTYSVNKDCTGSFSLVFTDGRPAATVNFVVATNGLEIDTVVVGTCPPQSSPPCTGGQGTSSIRSIGKKRFVGSPD